MSVLSEMLAEMCPGQEKPADLELLRELYATCRNMQARLVELVDRVANDEITAHLLKINDDLNNLFLRYFLKNVIREKESHVSFLTDTNVTRETDMRWLKELAVLTISPKQQLNHPSLLWLILTTNIHNNLLALQPQPYLLSLPKFKPLVNLFFIR